MRAFSLQPMTLALTALAAAGATALAVGAVYAGPRAHPGDRGPARTIQGVVVYYNHSPRGPCDAIMVQAGDKLVQVNMPPHAGPKIMQAFAVGERVTVVAVAEESKGDHAVVQGQSIRGEDGKQFDLGPAGPHPPGPIDTLRGTIKWLNFARHGEVNGAIFDSGDFVHLGPHASAEFHLAVGQMLTVEGPSRALPGGHRMIEHATRVNGRELQHDPPPPHERRR